MSDLLSFAAGEAMAYLGDGADLIQAGEATAAVLRALRLRKHQIGSVGRLLTGQYFLYTPNSKQFSLAGQPDFVSASYVDRLVDSVNSIFTKVTIVDVPEIDLDEWQGNYAIAFFGEPDIQAMLSWDPAFEQYNTLRIWYDPQAMEPGALTDDLAVPLKILPLLLAEDAALMLVAQCRMRDKDMWDGETVKIFTDTHLVSQRRLEAEFDMWRFEEEDSGPYQSERFDADRRSLRRFPNFRA